MNQFSRKFTLTQDYYFKIICELKFLHVSNISVITLFHCNFSDGAIFVVQPAPKITQK